MPRNESEVVWSDWFHGGEGVYAQFDTEAGEPVARLRWDQRWKHYIADKFCKRYVSNYGTVTWGVYVDYDAQDKRYWKRASKLVESAYQAYIASLILGG